MKRKPARQSLALELRRAFGRNIAAAELHWRTLEGDMDDERTIGAIHDLRVAFRRIEVLGGIFLGPVEAMPDLRRLIRALGRVRELDVTALLLAEEKKGKRREEALRECGRLRARRAKRLRFRLDEAGRVACLGRLDEELGKALSSGKAERLSFAQSARRRVLPIWRSFSRNADHVAALPSDMETLHQMRIAGKPLRYVMEIYAPAFGREFRRSIAAVKEILELMGEIHDRDVALGILSGFDRPVVRALAGRQRRRRSELRAKLSSRLKGWRSLGVRIAASMH